MGADKTFAYHRPSEEGARKIADVRGEASGFKAALEAACPPSRELSVALTHLETAVMWATKAIVVNDPCSEVAS